MLRYLCLLAFVILGVKAAIAPFIKPCKAGDKACLLSSAQAAVPYIAQGIPALGMLPLDPMELKEVHSDEGGIKLTLKDTIMTGMKGCSVDNVKSDLEKGRQQVTIRCSVTLKGQYTLGGRLLAFSMQGEGPYVIKILDIIIKAYSEVSTVTGEDGKPHWEVGKWHHNYYVKTSTTFDFDNLFNGNKILAEPISQFLNANWRDVMDQVAGPIVQAIVTNVVNAIKGLYKAVPAEELYIP